MSVQRTLSCQGGDRVYKFLDYKLPLVTLMTSWPRTEGLKRGDAEDLECQGKTGRAYKFLDYKLPLVTMMTSSAAGKGKSKSN